LSDALLEVRDLRVESRAGVIVDGLNLDLAAGETIGIVGESGSGKSLTARALIGLLPAGVSASGRASLNGKSVLASTERDWRRIRGGEIALMLQDPFTMLSPLMRVGRQITETIRDEAGKKLAPDRASAEAVRRLAEVGIHDPAVAARYPFQLSGGMRQRVGLASALASNPRILIADEPSTALDVTTQREILQLIRATQERRGMGVILITHDLRVAFAVCRRIYVLYAGELVEVGTATALERHPFHPYTHGLLASEPPVGRRIARLVAIPGAVPAAADVLDRCAFADRCAWVEGACLTERPPMREAAPGRFTACRRIDEIAAQLTPAVLAPASALAAAAMSEMAATIRVRELVKVYGREEDGPAALDGVSLEVRSGESVGLVGESGSGKTTLARCLVGLERPTSGSVAVDGVEVSDYRALSAAQRAQARRAVQIVFQDPYSTLNPARSVGFTLREAIKHAPDHATEPRRSLAELLELVGLPASYAARKPAALSGGERQRVAIARALALQPKVLICDEPVSALDVSVQAQILNLLAELRERLGVGYLFITHDLAVVRQATDRVYVLYRGIVVEAGATEDVLSAPAHEYTRALIESIPQSTPTWLAPTPAPAPS
jgi:peptide/nickel transport system ATP-binding protein